MVVICCFIGTFTISVLCDIMGHGDDDYGMPVHLGSNSLSFGAEYIGGGTDMTACYSSCYRTACSGNGRVFLRREYNYPKNNTCWKFRVDAGCWENRNYYFVQQKWKQGGSNP